MAAADVKTVLPQGVGYGVVVGIGFFFALLMCGVSYVQVRHKVPGNPQLVALTKIG